MRSRGEARRRSRDFLAHRLPKFLGYFERVMACNPDGDKWLAGKRLSYADLSMAQVIAGAALRVSGGRPERPACVPALARAAR